jgi:cytochrome bd-type quinol oxidase subunit 1
MATSAADVALHIHSSGDGSAAGPPEQNDNTSQAFQVDASGSSSISRSSTQRSRQLTIYSANSIAQHYFGSQKQLDILSEPTKMDDAVSAAEKAEEEAAVPPRTVAKTKMYINSTVLGLLLAVTIWAYYNNIRDILEMQRWYALIVIVLVPIGIVFFAFAVNIAVMGLFSVFIGEWCCSRELCCRYNSALH